MDTAINPFAPGAGTKPPELTGRTVILKEAHVALRRIQAGRSHKSQMLLGLRGTGKTVLLNEIKRLAVAEGYEVALIEAPERMPLQDLLFPPIRRALLQMSTIHSAKHAIDKALRALRSFASALKVSYQDVSLAVEPALGIADSGNLELDLPDLLLEVGQAAQAARQSMALLVDEVQYLDQAALSALIVALHRTAQEQLPVLFFGAGLPQVTALAGNAKSYAERLFHYVEIGALSPADARHAVRGPIEAEGAHITDAALTEIVNKTQCYPYFLQEWGYHAWNLATGSGIELADSQRAEHSALKELDSGFFRVRFDRLTRRERQYARAMAALGSGPYRSSDIAAALAKDPQAVAPFRAGLIKKGMAYSPSYGDVAFTVPMFDAFLRRLMPAGFGAAMEG